MLDLEETLAVLDKHVATYGHSTNDAFERVRETYDCACGEWTASGFSLQVGAENDLHRAHVAQMLVDENKRSWIPKFWKYFDEIGRL